MSVDDRSGSIREDRKRPNVVLMMADDMGYSDIGCFGSEIRTPHLDRLAAGGLRLTQMYNYARCCPTRASLLTGLYPHQAGIGHMMQDYGVPGYRGHLNDCCVTIAEALGSAGYRTAMSGKWHVGGQYSTRAEEWTPGAPGFPRPTDRGFDTFYGTLAGAGSYFNPHALMRDDAPIEPEGDDFYYTDAISDNAVGMIETFAPAPEPFFLYVAYTAPHWPLHAPPADIETYRGTYLKGWDAIRTERLERMRSMGLLDPTWPITPRDEQAPPWSDAPDKDWEDARMAVYAAQIDRMDQGIGRIMAALREHGLEEDTLVMFLSDNGGCAELLREDGVHASAPELTRTGEPVRSGNVRDLTPGTADTFMSYDLPWANASNTPFRLYKHWVHEGGISTPFIAHWPAAIPPGRIAHQPAHLIDVMPTILEVARATYPETSREKPVTPLEGESLTRMLRGEEWSRERAICWEHEGNRAVRLGSWKLVSRHPGGWELYDMAADRTEMNDLAGTHAQLVEQLAAIYDEWVARCGVLPWEDVRPGRG